MTTEAPARINVGALLARHRELSETKSELAAAAKAVNDAIREIETQIRNYLESEGVTQTADGDSVAYLQEKVTWKVDTSRWEMVDQSLRQKRINNSAVTELFAQGDPTVLKLVSEGVLTQEILTDVVIRRK